MDDMVAGTEEPTLAGTPPAGKRKKSYGRIGMLPS